MKSTILQRTIQEFQQPFLAEFNRLSEQDFYAILAGSSETFLQVLHKRYGYTRQQAIRAWNEFVLKYVDGHGSTMPCGHAGQLVPA
ncbi:MAG: hypothetical protein R2932_47325 [Caldilineaceae bacterium]